MAVVDQVHGCSEEDWNVNDGDAGAGSEKNWLPVLGYPPRQSYALVKETRNTSVTGKESPAAATWCVAGFTEAVTDLHGPQCLTAAIRTPPVAARHPRVPQYGQDRGGGSGTKPSVRDLHFGEELSGRGVVVAWVIASVTSQVERVGECASSPSSPVQDCTGPQAVRWNSARGFLL